MKKNIIIFLSVIIGAIVLRYGFSAFSNFMQSKNMMNKPAPNVSIQEIQNEINVLNENIKNNMELWESLQEKLEE